MVIVCFVGGLGNQLFQYALYKKFSILGKEVKADLTVLKRDENSEIYNGFLNVKDALSNVGIYVDAATEEDLKPFKDRRPTRRILRHFLGYRKNYYEQKKYAYDEKVLTFDDAYLYGYWQTEKYFKDIRDGILDDIKFPEIVGDSNLQVFNEIKNTNSVSIHIRAGDYTKGFGLQEFGNICTNNYYRKAICYIQKNIEDANFYVFTNDVTWVRKNIDFGTIKIHYVDWNTDPEDALFDLYLITQCKHNIVSNSSFSWWGGWLNENPNKIVIAPQKWTNLEPTPDVVPQSWVQV